MDAPQSPPGQFLAAEVPKPTEESCRPPLALEWLDISIVLCHLPNPDLALREAYRVLEPGGRVAFSVWDVPEKAVGIGAVYAAIRAHGSMDVGLPAGPNFFLFSDPVQSIKALQGAGFDSPNVRQVSQVWRLDDPDGIFDRLAGSTVRAGKTLRSQSPGATAAIRAALTR